MIIEFSTVMFSDIIHNIIWYVWMLHSGIFDLVFNVYNVN